ncbi:Glycosyltransferase sugar-binding region containing DXD motif-containing protein [Algoriella xinjiangensis]|uniref:Glycosyltransferase sugar-binding region containing DXD motif-containing protein n=1 Tax=Algoriella xinjiangensis TaxID=684065 RepID=A0A1I4VF81_9FLAO|nr:glycosyltransferase [Algoriella xinjiangensis]SFM99838.1 Glycosyltransferase sugar-binding region containing DXD motif-containing protein [Algoriella xinjiangensis]
MIPKKIHYCWFGNNPKPKIVETCIASWEKYLPDYEIIEWNESNFDVNQNDFVKTAYQNKKWAFVSDFARAKALYENGGFYLDTDMEVKNTLNDFLHHRAVCGFEIKGIPYSAFWGIEKGHILAQKIMNYYLTNQYAEEPNTAIFSRLLVDEFGADAQKDEYQNLKEGIALYPSTYFSLDLPINYVTHHFSGSWHDSWTSEKNTYKEMVNMYGVLNAVLNEKTAKEKVKNVVYNHKIIEIKQVLDQIPTRYIFNYLIDKIFKR